jgi:hypothetical protein
MRDPLHTGEVAGSIPAAPTIASVCLLSTNFGEHKFSEISAQVSAQESLYPYLTVGLTGTRAGGFVMTRQEPAGRWGAATYSLVRTRGHARGTQLGRRCALRYIVSSASVVGRA